MSRTFIANVPSGGDNSIRYFFVVERTPAGEAPDEIRRQWIGLPLPVRYPRRVEAPDPVLGVGLVTRQPVSVSDGIAIWFSDCIEALTRGGRSGAAAYWEVMNDTWPIPILIFQASEGRLLPVELACRLMPELDDLT